MSWLTYFALAVIVTGFAAVTGIKAKNTRHVARTQMMGMARLALWAIAVVFVSLAVRAYAGR
jgi:hypothetical protein